MDRENFIKEVNKLKNFKAFNSKANFVLVKVNENSKNLFENELDNVDFLISKFVFENFMRVSIGSKQHTEKFLEVLTKVD